MVLRDMKYQNLGRPENRWGEGGFAISDEAGQGEGVVCEISDVRKI